MYRVNATLHPGLRESQISAYADGVVVTLYTVFNLGFSAERLREGLNDLADWLEGLSDELVPGAVRVFYYESDRHGALIVDALSATPGLSEFLTEQLGGGAWGSVRP